MLTNIGLDHTQFLGSTVEKIAETKAGIFKPGSHAVLYEQSPSVTAVVRQACERVGIPLEIADFSQLRCLSPGSGRPALHLQGPRAPTRSAWPGYIS